MAINLHRLINSQFGLRAVSFLGRTVPPSIGFRVADLVANWIAAQRRSRLVRAIRTNQWVVRGTGLDKEALDQAVRDTLKTIAHSQYSLHHYIHDPEAVRNLVDLDPLAHGLVARPEHGGQGIMLVGLHMSNFDLILQSMSLQGLKALVLTIPNPQGARQLEFEMRQRTGMNLVPASVSGIKKALNHLERGGVVLTGLDRPVPEAKVRPKFFGRPSSLPVHHIYLALKASAPVVIVAARQGPDGRYHVSTSEPIEMESDPDREKEIVRNAERVLEEAEKFIRLAPEQWSISLPVWPELMDSVPI